MPTSDSDWLIDDAVAGNTFRGLAHQQPSVVFRGWARQLPLATSTDLGNVTSPSQLETLVEWKAASLADHWKKHVPRGLAFGPCYKMVNLLHKSLIRDSLIRPANRDRVIPLLHVPHDEYCFAAVRLSAASGRFGVTMRIPKTATMSFIKTREQYQSYQDLLRVIAAGAGVPPICIDLVAWNLAHGM